MRNNSGNIAVVAIVVLLVGTSAFAIYNAVQDNKGKSLFSFPGIDRRWFAPGPSPSVGGAPGGGSVSAGTGLKPPPSGSAGNDKKSSETAETTSSEVTSLNVPEKFAGQNISPYFGRVKISSMNVSQMKNKGSFTLRVEDIGGGTVSLTGWRLQGNKNNRVTLPQGYDAHNPFYDQIGPILGRQGDVINVYTEKSNFTRSVRVNKCMGYLNDVFGVNPKFSSSCPRVVDLNGTVEFTGKCQNFLRSISGCKVPTGEEMSVFRDSDRRCYEYMQGKFGYESCYRDHNRDKDFSTNTWYVWLKGVDLLPFDSAHDKILLFDADNQMAGEYIY